MAKYYSGISEGETLDSMLANGSTYGISPSQTIDCSSIIADTNIGIGTTNPESKLTVAATSATAQIEIKRLNSNETGTVGALNFTAFDGHSVANISAVADGDNEGAHLVFRTTSAAAEHSPFGGSTLERLRIESNGLVKGTLHTLIGEHSAATTAGQLFSFGNGATDNEGPAMPFAGEVVVVTISKSGGTNAGIFQPSKNGVTQGSTSDQITTTTGSGSVTKNNANYTSLMDFAAGDRINYVTIDDTDTTTCLTMVVRFNP